MIRRSTLFLVWLVLLLFAVSNTVQANDANQFDAHAVSFNYFFKDGDMDFHFGNLVLGAAVNGGVEIGEAYYAASQIKDGDAESWQNQWMQLADRVEKRGDESLSRGHEHSAARQYLRAAYYNRISLVSMLPDNPNFSSRGKLCRELMQKGGKLFDPLIEYLEIPFEDVQPRLFSQSP